MDKMREEFNAWIDGLSYSELDDFCALSAWKAWQASRQALVVQLPYQYEPEIGKDHIMDSEEVKGSLDKAGIKWTE